LEKEQQKNQNSNSNSKNQIKTKENDKKKQSDPPVLDLMINFKHCVIENKKLSEDLILNDLKRFEPSSANAKTKNLKIKDKRTSSIPNSTTNNSNTNKNLNLNLSELDMPILATKELTIKPIMGLRTQFPPIEVKGTNNLQISKPFLDSSSQILLNEFENDSILSRKNSIQLNDAFNLSSMLVNKPYQLSRFPTNDSAFSSKPSTSLESNPLQETAISLSSKNESLLNQSSENEMNQFNLNRNQILSLNQNKVLTAKPPPVLNKQKLRVHHPPHFKKLTQQQNDLKKEKTNESIIRQNELNILPMIIGIKPNNSTSNDEIIETLDLFYNK
jgi:hypothetical protein